MVDMDQTLIEAVPTDDPRYDYTWGQVITFQDFNGEIGRYRVHIRPHAIDMVNEIVRTGNHYIVWSAGTYYYVHAMMRYFSQQSQCWPETIYTREDMVLHRGQKYKSMHRMGYSNFLIIDDNPELIIPTERDRIVRIGSWSLENHEDRDLNWVSSLLQIYTYTVPVTIQSKNQFRMTDLES